jgi:genome maintenance exonuclease 1
MYISKFPYSTLKRVEKSGSRHYLSPTGDKLPSVTTILEATKSAESIKKLQNWRNRVGHDVAKQTTTEAANRGTKMHSYLEKYILESKILSKPDNVFHQSSWVMAQKVIDNGLLKCQEFWGTEINLHFPKVYAGTTDCIGIHDNHESIIDFKQSNKIKKVEWIEDYFLQLCAYSNAHNELYGTKISRGVIMMCVKPEVNNQGNIISEPIYQEFILEGAEYQKYNDMWWRRLEEYYTKYMI